MTRPALPDQAEIFATVDATWPAAAVHHAGPWLVREGRGAGKRVSAATATGPVTEADIALAEQKHRDLGQTPLFMIRPGDEALDGWLAARGYQVIDPVQVMAVPVADLPSHGPMRSFPHWPPLAMARDIWLETGIGPERQAVMMRVAGPHCALLGRSPESSNRAAGAAFVGLHGRMAMIHAVEVLPDMRRQRSAHHMLCSAGHWAQAQGAEWLSLVVVRQNAGAIALYASLNMAVVGQYHYRSA